MFTRIKNFFKRVDDYFIFVTVVLYKMLNHKVPMWGCWIIMFVQLPLSVFMWLLSCLLKKDKEYLNDIGEIIEERLRETEEDE